MNKCVLKFFDPIIGYIISFATITKNGRVWINVNYENNTFYTYKKEVYYSDIKQLRKFKR